MECIEGQPLHDRITDLGGFNGPNAAAVQNLVRPNAPMISVPL